MLYADYNGSAPLLPIVREHLRKRLDSDLFANPNAIHSIAQKLAKGIEKSRQIVAEVVGAYPDQIFFNSGASEGITQVIHSILTQINKSQTLIITSPVEHSVIPNALSFFEKQGFEVIELEIDENGIVRKEHLEKLLEDHRGKVALVTVMAANNETGVLQPYQEIASICREEGVEFFCDTTQLIGKGDFHFDQSGLDYAVCSGHKIGALSGSGFIIAREPTKLVPLIFGSTQEKSLRGGTQHYLGIETLALALRDYQENKETLKELAIARRSFEQEIKSEFPQVVIVGETAPRLAGTTLIGFPGIHGQAVQIELESQNIFVTTSAACTDNQPETSRVLRAMGIGDQVGRGVIRISLSYSHGKKDYSTLARALKAAYTKLIKIQSF